MTRPDAVLDAPGVASGARALGRSARGPGGAGPRRSRRSRSSPTSCATTRCVRDALVAVACASRSLSTALVADPTLLDPLRDPTAFAAERTRRRVPRRRSTPPASTTRTALRRWKRRELLRIAARDLLGVADLPAVGRELAALAEVCLEARADARRARRRRSR